MKVLLVATVQSHICQFHGHEVHVAARDNLAEKNGLKLDFVEKVFDVPFSRSPKSPDNIKAYKQLKKIIDEGHYDVVHCNTPMGGIVTRLAAGKARKNGTRVYYTAHGFHFYQGAPKKNWLVFYPIEKFFSRKTDKLLTITQEDYNLASKKFYCKVYRTHGVGVDERRYFPVSEEEKKRLKEEMGFSGPVILNVGELLPNKNQKMAISMIKDVVKQYPDAVLLIAGNGPEKENLEKQIAELGLEKNVKLLGYCTHLQDYQHIADVLVACSYREGLPLNIVEAMLSGTPIVASLNRGHRELIDDGINGYLVEADDIAAMANKVSALLDDKEKTIRMIDAAKGKAVFYGFDNVKKELTKVYGLE